MFIQRKTTKEISASLLFRAGKIKRLVNAARNIDYMEGKDFKLSNDGKTIVLLPESRVPVVKHDELYKAGKIVVDENISIFQVYVTYVPKDKDYWTGFYPKNTHDALPHTRARLNNKNPLTLGIIGDSIAAGWNSSKHMGFPPYQPSFVELFADKIKKHYKADVHVFNYAAAGATTLRADEDSKRIAEIKPDLVVIAYGINDALFSTPIRDYMANIQNAVNTIKRENPRCEFIIVSSSLGNPKILHEANKRMLAYSDALRGLVDDSVVISDMSRLWEYLLAGKKYMDITGNGCNHPNDFGHVLYAQSLFELIKD